MFCSNKDKSNSLTRTYTFEAGDDVLGMEEYNAIKANQNEESDDEYNL